MLESEDLYEILQVHPSAHPEVLQASHRQLVQLYSPNRFPYPNAQEMLAAVDKAYAVLGDPVRRADYDIHRKTRATDSDVVRARTFQVLDENGEVRAELGCRVVKYQDSSDDAPLLELKDPEGHVRFSASLDYFDNPHLFMGVEEEGDDRFSVSVDTSGQTQLVMRDQGQCKEVEISSGNLSMRDSEEVTRLQVGLSGGDEGDSPCLVMRDRAGRTRLEMELDEVELDRMVAQVGDDYELSPLIFAYPPRLRLRDQRGNVRIEVGLFGTDSADTPILRVLDLDETPRLEIGYSDDSPWVTMQDRDGNDRLEVELAEVETEDGYDYVPQVRLLDEDENVLQELELPLG